MIEATQVLDLDAINAMPRDEFVAALGSTFEHSPWVAEAAWPARPFASAAALHVAMMDVVRRAPRDTQVAFLCAHPELAGKEAQEHSMTSDSVAEQASAGLDALNRAEIGVLRERNATYCRWHGFPFIVAVRRYRKAEIFEQLRYRMARDSDTELAEALNQVSDITRFRVQARLGA